MSKEGSTFGDGIEARLHRVRNTLIQHRMVAEKTGILRAQHELSEAIQELDMAIIGLNKSNSEWLKTKWDSGMDQETAVLVVKSNAKKLGITLVEETEHKNIITLVFELPEEEK